MRLASDLEQVNEVSNLLAMVEREFEDWWLSPPFSGPGLAVSGVVAEWNVVAARGSLRARVSPLYLPLS